MKDDHASVALLHYSTHNLGDDIQSFAVRRFIDAGRTCNRDKLQEMPSGCALLLYGWLLRGRQWPPSPGRIYPFSIHAAPSARPLLRRHIEWWRPLGTIPCRDVSSTEFFLRHGINAVFEGCATLSLERWIDRQAGSVVFVDVAMGPCSPAVNFPEINRRTHKIRVALRNNQAFRQKAAREALEAYQRAELVITSRLHAMLPCLAFGTPVVYVPGPKQREANNFTRLIDYLPYVETWDGSQVYASGGRPPLNFQPTALRVRVRERLESIGRQLAVPGWSDSMPANSFP